MLFKKQENLKKKITTDRRQIGMNEKNQKIKNRDIKKKSEINAKKNSFKN